MSNLTSLLRGENNLPSRRSMDSLLQTNEISSQYGLTLTQQDVVKLVQIRNEALRGYGRLEFGAGVLNRLALAFCDSPYVSSDTYADILAELTELFYQTKSESLERMPDDLVIDRMKEAFNGACEGSLKSLAIVMDTIAYNIRVYGTETAPEAEETEHTHDCGHDHGPDESDEESEFSFGEGEEDGNWRTVRF
ncbi:DUF6323 family protein [Marasmitruncus massiliensis]|uniref:DUF6323 family protein n=1 Tax=Marasmitruncus massiliensis TaxID=1944642 RepID=UPI000C7A64D0|nr:DUF6323 family protein [Marasmitruncus massiliensis]